MRFCPARGRRRGPETKRPRLSNKTPLLIHALLVVLLLLSVSSVPPSSILAMATNTTVITLAGKGPPTGESGFVDGNGTSTARFNSSRGIAVLPKGNLVVADTNNHAIRIITMPNGIVSTLAGKGPPTAEGGFVDGNGTLTARFNGPMGIATVPNGNLAVADYYNHAIRLITMPDGVVSTLAGKGPPTGQEGFADGTGTLTTRFYAPRGIATLPNGDLVVADTNNHAIRTITMPNGIVSTLAGKGPPTAQGGFVDGNGTLTARFNQPIGIATLPNGDLVVADFNNHAIRIITMPNGIVSTLAGKGPPTAQSGFVDGTGTLTARFTNPHGIAVLPNGNLVVAEYWNHVIRIITMPDGIVSTLAGKGPPTGQSGFVDGTGTLTARFWYPIGVATLPNGNLVVADYSNHAIRTITMGPLLSSCPGAEEMCHSHGVLVRGLMMNGTQSNCSCDCSPGYDRATNCSSKLPCPSESFMCNGNGNVTGNVLDGCGCVCLAGFDNRTNCSTTLSCPINDNNSSTPACHGKGNVSGNLQIGCSCECEPGYNVSTNCSTPLECPASMCNGNGNVTGNVLEGCGCACLAAFDNRTNCSTPLPCPNKNSTCHGKGTLLGNLLVGCNCSCDAGFDPKTNCSTQLTAAAPVIPPTTTTTSPTVTSSPATTELPSTPYVADPPPTTAVVDPPSESDCGPGSILSFNASAAAPPLLDPEYEKMWARIHASTLTPLASTCDSEWHCAIAMKNCTVRAASSSPSSCDAAAVGCTRRYMECLVQAAQNSSARPPPGAAVAVVGGCPRLEALNASLHEWTLRRSSRRSRGRDDAYELFEQRMLQRCALSMCRILSYATDHRPCHLNWTAAAHCPLPSEATTTERPRPLSGPVSTVVGRTAATVIVSATTGGTAMAALISSPTAATKVPALASLTGVIQCAFTEDDTEPSPFDFPIPASIGSSSFAKYVGSGLLTTLCLVVLPVLGTLVVGRVRLGERAWDGTVRLLQKKVLANGAMMTLGYFGPLAFKLPVLIVWHSQDAADIALALLCPLLVLCLILHLLFAVVGRFDSSVTVVDPSSTADDSSELEFINKDPNGLFVETFGVLFDACRSVRLRHRLLFFEDFLLAAVLQLLKGVRPKRENSCSAAAAMMGVVCWLHTLYLVVVRPYRDRLELVLVIIGSLLMSAMGTLGLIITLTVPAEQMAQSAEFVVFAYLGLATTLWFFAQSCIVGLAAFVEVNKKAFDKRMAVGEERAKADSVSPLDIGKAPISDPSALGPPSMMILPPRQGTPQGVLETPLLLFGIGTDGAPPQRPLRPRTLLLHRSDDNGDSSVFNPLAC